MMAQKSTNSEECSVCVQPFRATRKRCACPFCGFESCVSCLQTFILSAEADASCMSCHRPLTHAHLQSICPPSWLGGPYRDFREQLLYAREMTLMPATVHLARRLRAARNYENRRREVATQFQALPVDIETRATISERDASRWLDTLAQATNSVPMLLQAAREDADTEVQLGGPPAIEAAAAATTTTTTTTNTPTTHQDVEPVKATPYVSPCPNTCNGFLDARGTCGICGARVCVRCHAALPTSEASHTCNPDEVASVTLLRRDTKPCPKCASRVYKTGGCDQMFCTACNTAFSWSSLKIVTRGIHNPHYFEWLFRTGGEHNERIANEQIDAANAPQNEQVDAAVPDCVNTVEDFSRMWNDYRGFGSARVMSAVKRFFAGRVIERNENRYYLRGEIHIDRAARDFATHLPREHAMCLMLRYVEECRVLLENYEALQRMSESIDSVVFGMKTIERKLQSVAAAAAFQRYRERSGMRDDDVRATNEDLRALFMLNEFDADQFKRELVMREAKRARDVERIELMRTYLDVAAQTLHALLQLFVRNPAAHRYGDENVQIIVSAVARLPGRAELLREVDRRLKSLDELRSFVNERACLASQRSGRATLQVLPDGGVDTLHLWNDRVRKQPRETQPEARRRYRIAAL